MVNGKHGDDPVRDLLAGREHSYPPDIAELIVELADLNPHLFSTMFNHLNELTWDWQGGHHLPEARTLLKGLIERPGDAAVRARLIREYRVAIGKSENPSW